MLKQRRNYSSDTGCCMDGIGCLWDCDAPFAWVNPRTHAGESKRGRQPAGDSLHMTAATSVLHCTTDMSQKPSPSRCEKKKSSILPLFSHDFSRTSRPHTITLRPMHQIPPASPYRAACIAYASAHSASSCSAMLCLANYECV